MPIAGDNFGPYFESSKCFLLLLSLVPSKSPENMTATAINSTAIIVQWKPPSPPFGAKLTGYLFYYRRFPQDKVYTELNIGPSTRVGIWINEIRFSFCYYRMIS